MKLEYFDIHSHLNFSAFDSDREEVIKRMQDEKVFTISVGTDLKTSKEVADLADKNENIFATIGLHPDDNKKEDFNPEDYKELAENKKVVAVGECGLDYYRIKNHESGLKNKQKEIFEKLRGLVNEQIGIVIVDSISMLYRLELGKSEEVFEVNSALGKQIGCLVEIARRFKIPVLITNQVYADFDNRDKVKMVGGDLLKYGSKCLIELRRFSGFRGMVLRKHRSLPEGKELKFDVVHKGILEIN